MSVVRNVVFVGIICALTGIAVTSQAQTNRSPDPQLTRLFLQERNAHVGETLPRGIKLMLDDGSLVDLRSHLRGPVILLKIYAKCGCDALFNAIRGSNGQGLGVTKATIVVVRVDDKGHESLNLPRSVMTFHTSSSLEDGFLGGHVLPATFYFDKNLKLVKRTPGMPMSPNALLYFPEQSSP